MEISATGFSAPPQQGVQQAQETTPESGVTIELRRGDDNVTSGDRSQNTLEISVTTPNNRVSTEITREQGAQLVERRLQLNALESLAGGNSNDPNALAVAALRSGLVDSSDLTQVAIARNQQQLAQSYLEASTGNNTGGVQPGVPAAPTTDPVQLANNAVDAYVRQTLFFSSTAQSTPLVDTLV